MCLFPCVYAAGKGSHAPVSVRACMPQDIRNLQSLESFLPLIASPSPGPGVVPLHTYSTSIDNSYCSSFM